MSNLFSFYIYVLFQIYILNMYCFLNAQRVVLASKQRSIALTHLYH